MKSHMEKVLGASIERPGLPGLKGNSQCGLYVSFNNTADPRRFMEEVIWHQTPPLVSNGGVVFDEWIVTIPDGTRFYALALNGDLAAWQAQIQVGARHHGSLTAGWSEGMFCVSDGRSFDQGACKIVESWRDV